jgi:hypothetical protein
MRIPYKHTKSASGDPRRPRRLQRCVNQDCSRGRNYTSNRGGHVTFNGSVRLDTSGIRPFVEAVCDAYSRYCNAYLTIACVLPLAGFLRGDFNRWRGLNIKAVQPKMPGASRFSKTGHYRVPSTSARRQQYLWRRNQPEPLPRGLRTAVATTTSRPPSSRTEVSVPEGARQIQEGPQPKELPRLLRPEG